MNKFYKILLIALFASAILSLCGFLPLAMADTTPPVGTVLINSGDIYCNSSNVTLTLDATDEETGVAEMRIANSQAGLSSASWQTYASSSLWNLDSGDGIKETWVEFKDGAGNIAQAVSDGIGVDLIAPTAYIYGPTYSTYYSANLDFNVQWGGYEDTSSSYSSGIADFEPLYRTFDVVDYTTIFGGWTTMNSTTFIGTPGYTYYFKSRCRDNAGNISSYADYYPTVVPFDEGVFTFSGTWSSDSNTEEYLGGTKYSSVKNSFAQYTAPVGTNSLMLITTGRPDSGKADIYIDNVKRATINCYSSYIDYRSHVWSISSLNPSVAHTIKVVVTRSKSSYSTGYRVDVDGLGIRR